MRLIAEISLQERLRISEAKQYEALVSLNKAKMHLGSGNPKNVVDVPAALKSIEEGLLVGGWK